MTKINWRWLWNLGRGRWWMRILCVINLWSARFLISWDGSKDIQSILICPICQYMFYVQIKYLWWLIGVQGDIGPMNIVALTFYSLRRAPDRFVCGPWWSPCGLVLWSCDMSCDHSVKVWVHGKQILKMLNGKLVTKKSRRLEWKVAAF